MSPRGTVWLDEGRAGRAHAGWGREVLRMSVVPAACACLRGVSVSRNACGPSDAVSAVAKLGRAARKQRTES